MSNMDEFNRITVLVLGKLYDSFPRATRVEVKDVHEAPDDNDVMNFAYTVEFLTSEGYIRHGGANDEGLFFIEVTLTRRA